MRILAIETSCDETGIALIDVTGSEVTIRSNQLSSQAALHAEFGGVFPTLAKREHVRALVPLLRQALFEAKIPVTIPQKPTKEVIEQLKTLLSREQELFVQLSLFSHEYGIPEIDAIAVTFGPGLEPALWVGVNFARALSTIWGIPIVAINHMEGHIAAALTTPAQGAKITCTEPTYPVLSLLVSGGHTELVLSESVGMYAVMGQTRDDAAGECFDKTARMLDLPYPGGPEISKLAAAARAKNLDQPFSLPRPMLHSTDNDFSFSGLKTAVLKLLKELGQINETQKMQLAREIEDAIVETLVAKTKKALAHTNARTLVISGGVSANNFLCEQMKAVMHTEYIDVDLAYLLS
jgi:N6-L-threonylcarbamoyladenine synthase